MVLVEFVPISFICMAKNRSVATADKRCNLTPKRRLAQPSFGNKKKDCTMQELGQRPNCVATSAAMISFPAHRCHF